MATENLRLLQTLDESRSILEGIVLKKSEEKSNATIICTLDMSDGGIRHAQVEVHEKVIVKK
ncbi:MAG: hypothetical protein KKF30_07450 [Proteobacteria bacterium]|nr:hypothetical protein [Pseudomonadota bacterium]MBU4470297.1 hypothetical protein [Pseudomonadota bacterium]